MRVSAKVRLPRSLLPRDERVSATIVARDESVTVRAVSVSVWLFAAFAVLAFALPHRSLATVETVSAQGVEMMMAVDMDPASPGVQSEANISGGSFVIGLVGSGDAGVAGYQWELGWDDSVLDYVAHSENTGATGADLCAPERGVPAARQSSSPIGKEWVGLGAGCITTSGTLKLPATLVEVTLACASSGITEIHLVTLTADNQGEDPAFGTTFYAPGGAIVPTAYRDARVTCGVGETAGDGQGPQLGASTQEPEAQPTVSRPSGPDAEVREADVSPSTQPKATGAEVPNSGSGMLRGVGVEQVWLLIFMLSGGAVALLGVTAWCQKARHASRLTNVGNGSEVDRLTDSEMCEPWK